MKGAPLVSRFARFVCCVRTSVSGVLSVTVLPTMVGAGLMAWDEARA